MRKLPLSIADSAQTEYCTTFHCSFVRQSVCHRRDISHFSHKCHVNHQGTHQTLYILNQNHPGYLSSKDQTREDHLLRPDQPDHWLWLWIIKNIMLNPQCLLCLVILLSWVLRKANSATKRPPPLPPPKHKYSSSEWIRFSLYLWATFSIYSFKFLTLSVDIFTLFVFVKIFIQCFSFIFTYH